MPIPTVDQLRDLELIETFQQAFHKATALRVTPVIVEAVILSSEPESAIAFITDLINVTCEHTATQRSIESGVDAAMHKLDSESDYYHKLQHLTLLTTNWIEQYSA